MKTYNVTIELKNYQADFSIKASNLNEAKKIAQAHKRLEYSNKGRVTVTASKY